MAGKIAAARDLSYDPFTALPESLICSHILTKLPLKDAVRSSLISRKWKRLWTRLPQLKFSQEFFDSVNGSTVTSVISYILMLHCAPVDVFQFSSAENYDNLYQWILCVALKGVREITLEADYVWERYCYSSWQVPASLFAADRLTCLRLNRCDITEIPNHFRGFACLVNCNLQWVLITDKLFEQLLSLCPLLQLLRVSFRRGPRSLRIASSSLVSLSIGDLEAKLSFDSITANCPRLENIEIVGFSGSIGLTKFNLCLPVCVYLATTDFEVLEQFRTVKSIRKITLLCDYDLRNTNAISMFPDIEELCIQTEYFTIEDVGDLMFTTRDLKKIVVKMQRFHREWEEYEEYCDKFIALLRFLLQSVPSLKTITVSMPFGLESSSMLDLNSFVGLRFANNVFNLPRSSPETQILFKKHRDTSPLHII